MDDVDRYGLAFAERLRGRREECGISRHRLARLSGGSIPYGSIVGYETQGHVPSVAKAAVLADALQCPLDWLAGRMGPSARGAGA